MLEVIQITFVCTVIAISYQILIMPSELLQGWARFINITFAGTPIQKLLLCPYCMGGQLSFWVSVVVSIEWQVYESFISVPCTIVSVYFIVKHNFK